MNSEDFFKRGVKAYEERFQAINVGSGSDLEKRSRLNVAYDVALFSERGLV